MLTSAALVVSFLTGLVLASPVASSHRLHERNEVLPRGWSQLEEVPRKTVLPMRIGLTQSNLDKGHDMLMDVSTHDSPNYGKYLRSEEIADFFAPSKHSIDGVMEWLESKGIGHATLSANKQWIQFDAPVENAEELLKTKYHVYQHEAGSTNVACQEYHVPEHLAEHIDYITPGIKLFANNKRPKSSLRKRDTDPKHHRNPPKKKPLPKPEAVLAAVHQAINSTFCQQTITPPCIQALYNITNGTKASPNNRLGIFEDLGDVYSQTDLNLFFKNFAPQIPQGFGPQLDLIDGAVAPVTNLSTAGAESDLDFQISYPIIYPQNSVLFQTDDTVYENNYVFEGFLNNFLDAIDGSYCTYSAFGETGNSPLDPPYPDPNPGGYKGKLQCGVYKPTNVISISYGGQEADLPASYQERQCNEFMKLGMQGVTVVVSSGDSGVAARGGPDNGCLNGGKVFNPQFPATCPYLLTVGGTVLPPGGNVFKDEEVAVTRFPSGGGFSNLYPIPSYQSAVVSNYLRNHNPGYPSYVAVNGSGIGRGGGIYNRAGRAYPDVSAIGDNVVIFNAGQAVLIGGTSASAPAWGGILTRINEERIAAGKRTVGFVNPVLYANYPKVLHDITVGNNSGCGTPGFFAVSGWDPVTGLGTPNYPALLKLFMAQP